MQALVKKLNDIMQQNNAGAFYDVTFCNNQITIIMQSCEGWRNEWKFTSTAKAIAFLENEMLAFDID